MTSKNKEPKHPQPEKLDFIDEIKESIYFQWLLENWKYTPYVFGIFLLLIALTFKFTSGKASKVEGEYVLAENYFQLLTQDLQSQKESQTLTSTLDKLAAITNNNPELHSRYDGLIAQILLTMGKNGEAKPFATRSLSRIAKDNTPLYIAFSDITLLIAEGSYKTALDRSIDLQKAILYPPVSHTSPEKKLLDNTAHLFAYNQLRIGILEKQAGTPEGERTAWNQWNQYLAQSDNSLIEEAYLKLNKDLTEGTFTLKQYINAREVSLKKEIQK